MESKYEDKVFHSDISRVDCFEQNNLYELIQLEPAKPVPQESSGAKSNSWEHRPHYLKLYSPKRAPARQKVKTVADVRAVFEKDLNADLIVDLELQKKYLLRKICDGLSREEKTKNVAINLLNSDKPLCKSSWQMLSNINPENHSHSKQFVLWDGKCLQVNGSKGGKNKFIFNYDLKTKLNPSLENNKSKFKRSALKPKLRLLRSSLSVKFKPGPLVMKKQLEVSHHRYHMGNVELVNLPVPVLEVSPKFGSVLDPSISCFVNNLRDEKGTISPKLAEFAVSVLGTVHSNVASQQDKNVSIDFVLNYKCQQNRILMRKNVVETNASLNKDSYTDTVNDSNIAIKECLDKSINDEIKEIVDKMLDSIDISIHCDSTYMKEDEPRPSLAHNKNDFVTSKDKSKRKYCELGKLDVTVINVLPENKKDYTKSCGKSFCTMGCICESLDCLYTIKQHCGVPDCMFGCKCGLSKYNNIELLGQDYSELIPGLLNLDNEINSHLAKEEQKFHQTVVVSGEKSILLKSRKRNWKSSKRYADFFSKMNLKNKETITKHLTVDVEKLNCENIEPYCMVHNLYKCFCKGKFIETYVQNDAVINIGKINDENVEDPHGMNKSNMLGTENTKKYKENCYKIPASRSILKPHLKKRTSSNNSNDFLKDFVNPEDDEISVECARTTGYHGRKYNEEFYITTNRKIKEMEQNDTLLKKKMMKLITGNSPISDTLSETTEVPLNCEEDGDKINEIDFNNMDKIYNTPPDNTVQTPDKTQNSDTNHNCINVIKDATSESKEDDVYIIESPVKDSKCCDDLRDIKNITTNANSSDINKFVIDESETVLTKNTNKKDVLKFPSTNPNGKISLQSWLESSYMSYKERQKKGIKDSLEAPLLGKSSFQTWNFILSRYTERKNMFFVSKKEPFQIFLAVQDKHPFFRDLINIDSIRFSDLPKYPILIRNLVTNTIDTENTFCMLRSWSYWWELIGSAVKIIEKSPDNAQEDVDIFDADNFTLKDDESEDDLKSECHASISDSTIQNTPSEKSRWFVLTLEKDFTEIHFRKKGFFVTYERIQSSITLARDSGKTVRLSIKELSDNRQNNEAPYGIYAIPCNTQSRVVIGPYEINEPLGIEAIKTVSDSKKVQKIRGIWINTNKVDNKNVIDNPLAYLPSLSIKHENEQLLESDTTKTDANLNMSPVKTLHSELQSAKLNKSTAEKGKRIPKQIKPIKIQRNQFYHLSPKKMSQKIVDSRLIYKDNLKEKVSFEKEARSEPSKILRVKPMLREKSIPEEIKPSTSCTISKPVAEVAPQIKITHVYSQINFQDALGKAKRSSMHILKPEEINKKIPEDATNTNFTADIEKFLEASTICAAPQEEICIISDDEDDAPIPAPTTNVWIQCSNVTKFGHICAKSSNEGISFMFPGFNYTDYYEESEAFDKINQVLARKIFIPSNVKLQWEIVRDSKMLNSDKLTTKCLEDKSYLLTKVRQHRSTGTPSTKEMKNKMIEGLEETSRKLEQERSILWNEAVTKKNEIMGSLSVPDNLKVEMSETLQDIMTMNSQ